MSRSVFSDHRYIEYQRGTSNIIITIPHGGNLRPARIPDRDAGAETETGEVVYSHEPHVVKDHHRYAVRYKKDTYTKELGLLLADRLTLLTGHRPHVLLCHLYRGKLDANCGIKKGCFGVPEAEEAWQAWHGYINEAKAQIEASHRRGLLLDIHGHRHQEEWTELGYAVSGEHLNNGTFPSEALSIQGMLDANHLTTERQVKQAVQGENSLGGILGRHGYKVVPSQQYLCPGDGSYYTGGYNTTSHGSHHGGCVDAIQLENPKPLRNAKAGPAYVEALASSIVEYMDLYYSKKG